jgi:hypothetical protein
MTKCFCKFLVVKSLTSLLFPSVFLFYLPFQSCPLWALVELIKIHTIPQQNMEKIAKCGYKETRLPISIGLPADKEKFKHHF